MAEHKIRLEYRKIDELIPYERNAKQHPPEQIAKLVRSFDEFERIVPAGITADGHLIYGHGRILAARERGDKDFPCVVIDHLSETQRRAFVHADNLLAESETDAEILRGEMIALQAAGFDISLTGFDPDGLQLGDESTQGDNLAADEDDYEAPPPSETTRTARGQIWQLGRHRLMCGDCTLAEDADALMAGSLADLVFTDPPYGVSYVDKNKFLNSIDNADRLVNAIEGDDQEPEDMHDFWVAAFKNLYRCTKERMSYYITAPQGGDLLLLLQAVRESGFALKHQIIWNKNNHVLGRCDYNYKHEPIIYGWKIGKTHKFVGGGSMLTSVWDVPKPLRSDLHPTMKPIHLIENAVLNSSEPGEIVLDLFGGSGSTLIACDQLKRVCYMMEIAPHYCDVIIDRWETLTGEKAVLVSE